MAKKKPVELAQSEEKQALLFEPDAPDTSGDEKETQSDKRYRIYGLNDYNAMMDVVWPLMLKKGFIEAIVFPDAIRYDIRLNVIDRDYHMRRLSPENYPEWLELVKLIAETEAIHYADYPPKGNK